MKLLGSLSALLIAGLGCGDTQVSVEDALKEWEPKVAAKLVAAETIGNQPTSGTAARWPKLTLVETYPEVIGDTVLAFKSELAVLANGTRPGRGMGLDWDLFSPRVTSCWYAIRKRELAMFDAAVELTTTPLKGFQVEMSCRELAQARYLAVVTPGAPAADAAPAVAAIPDDPDALPDSFQGATTGGVIDLYELPSGASLGRKRYDAASSGRVDYKTTTSGVGASLDADRAIGKDLTRQTRLAIRRAVTGS